MHLEGYLAASCMTEMHVHVDVCHQALSDAFSLHIFVGQCDNSAAVLQQRLPRHMKPFGSGVVAISLRSSSAPGQVPLLDKQVVFTRSTEANIFL